MSDIDNDNQAHVIKVENEEKTKNELESDTVLSKNPNLEKSNYSKEEESEQKMINSSQVSKSKNSVNPQIKIDLINEINEKEKIFDVLVKSNEELKQRIEISTQKYHEIVKKIQEKQEHKSESKLSLQIKEMEKQIAANNAETDRYKKKIDNLKGKIEFKSNLERAFNLQNVLKQETLKNKELNEKLSALSRIKRIQNQYISNYDKENQISEKIDFLKNEIKQNRDSIKGYQEKFAKQDRFIRIVHEKILSLEMIIKKMKEPKTEPKKIFSKEDLKSTIDLLNGLKDQIHDNRTKLDLVSKQNEIKMHQLLKQNKEIEEKYKKIERKNKDLIIRKNELKKNIRSINMGHLRVNSKTGRLNNNKSISMIQPDTERRQFMQSSDEKEDINNNHNHFGTEDKSYNEESEFVANSHQAEETKEENSQEKASSQRNVVGAVEQHEGKEKLEKFYNQNENSQGNQLEKDVVEQVNKENNEENLQKNKENEVHHIEADQPTSNEENKEKEIEEINDGENEKVDEVAVNQQKLFSKNPNKEENQDKEESDGYNPNDEIGSLENLDISDSNNSQQ